MRLGAQNYNDFTESVEEKIKVFIIIKTKQLQVKHIKTSHNLRK